MNVIIIQETVPEYRLDLFDRLSREYGDTFCVYTSEQLRAAPWCHALGPVRVFGPIRWQSGVLQLVIRSEDIVIVPGDPRCLTNFLLLVKAKWRGARTICWTHFWSSTSKKIRAHIRWWIFSIADVLLFYTDKELESYRGTKWGRWRDRRAFAGALNNGLDCTAIRHLRKTYDLEARENRIAFIGRLTDKAQMPLLIQAMSMPSCHSLELHVIGSGENERDLRALASDLGVGNRIRWYGTVTEEREIAEVLNRCAAFVYPGAVGLSVVHALAYGLPSVLHDRPDRHMPEVSAAIESTAAHFFKMGDSMMLSEAIHELLSNRGELVRMSKAATNLTDRTYNTEDMTARFLSIANRLASV